MIGGNVKFAPAWTTPSPTIAKLDFAMDGATLASRTTAPFEYTWNSTSTNPGLHLFTFIVTDTAGNTGQLSIHLLVQPPVTVQIAQPLEGAIIEGKNTIITNVTVLGSVDRIEFVVDGEGIGTVTSAPYQLEWNPASLPAGKHVISVTVYDTENFSAQAQVSVNVALKQGLGALWIAALAIFVLLVVLIPLSLRKRKQFNRNGVSQFSMPGQAALHELEGLNPGKIWPLGSQEVRLGANEMRMM